MKAKAKNLILIAAIFVLTACGNAGAQQQVEEKSSTVQVVVQDKTKDETPAKSSGTVQEKEKLESDIQETEETEEIAIQSEEQEQKQEQEGAFWLEGIDLSTEEMETICSELKSGWDAADKTDPDYEEKVIQKIADAHGITADQAGNIYIYMTLYGGPKAQNYYSIEHGKFLEAKASGTTLIIKVKITPSLTNDLTIKQNYFNVCDIIRNQHGDDFDEIQYWAVADMTSGNEAKVISFTVPKELIEVAASKDFPDTALGDYVEDLYIHPSLRTE